MIKRKMQREHGKIKLSRYFQDFKEGDRVAILRELAISSSFPKRIHGRTGEIKGTRGKAYIVAIKEYNQNKTFIIDPVHLRKLK